MAGVQNEIRGRTVTSERRGTGGPKNRLTQEAAQGPLFPCILISCGRILSFQQEKLTETTYQTSEPKFPFVHLPMFVNF